MSKKVAISLAVACCVAVIAILLLRPRSGQAHSPLRIKIGDDIAEVLSSDVPSKVTFWTTAPKSTIPEAADLLARYLTAPSLEQYDALFVNNEFPPINVQQFVDWKKNMDLATKTVTLICDVTFRNARRYIVVYDSSIGDTVMTDTFVEKRVNGSLHPIQSSEYRESELLQGLFRTVTPLGIEFLSEQPRDAAQFFSVARYASDFNHKVDLLLAKAIKDHVLDAAEFVGALNAYSKSNDEREREVASLFLHPDGVHAVKMLTVTDLTDEVRAHNAQLINFMKQSRLSDAQIDDVLLSAANKEYMPAAQKLRDYCSGGKAAVYGYVVKINEFYGPVIQISRGSDKAAR